MNVLGLSCWFHDSSAALVVDGKVVSAAAEERFTRIKHDTTFPSEAIDYCLQSQGITFDDIDVVCFYEKPLLKLERVMQTGKAWQEKGTSNVQDQVSHGLREGLFLDKVLEKDYGYTGRICYTQHHIAHAASSYYVSGFEEAAILTADGVGEWATTTKSVGRGSTIELLGEIHYPDSLGLFYSTITAFLGFKVNNDEYKVMGLASYGQPKYETEILKLIDVFEDGSFKLNMEYFSFPYSNRRMYNRKIEEVLGEARFSGDEVTQRHMDIASSAQKVLEDIMVKMATQFHKETGLDYLCIAGGVALNCVANWKIRERSPFKEVFVQPAAGDDGGCVGAALHAYYTITGEGPKSEQCYDTWLGPEFNEQQILEVLQQEDAVFTQYSDDEIFKQTAKLIAEDNIIGWFQGRMEFGPRALGSRSILANPTNPDMKDILNKRVKFREEFRPFAPAVTEEQANDYFDLECSSPYMLMAPKVKGDTGERLPSITHVDNTARVQTVNKDMSPRFHALIHEFGQATGVPVVINTSFNVRGEPIVCSPQDAYNCFMKTDIDYLVIGNYVVEKDF